MIISDMSDTSHQAPAECSSHDSEQHPTIANLLNRRSIRHFKPSPVPPKVIDTLETVAQHAATSQYLNSWSMLRVEDEDLKQALARIGRQPYIAEAPLLYVFIIDQHRNARLAERQGVDTASEDFTLNSSYIFAQSQNDAVLALHAMETAAYALGLGCVILGSVLNDIDGLIDLLKLPALTYPVLGLAIGEPDEHPALKPRLPKAMQVFENTYPDDATLDLPDQALEDFDSAVHHYYDLRDPSRPLATFSEQIAAKSQASSPLAKPLEPPAIRQGFTPGR